MASVPETIPALVERFARHVDDYRRGRYNETQVRREFIDPFFVALGWDVHNTAGYAEAYRDVIHEAAVKVGGVTQAPDYSFRVGGARKFFVEAKRPSVSIHDAVEPAYKLRRYAWSANLPLSILTDFEELAVYDCRTRPRPKDKPAVGRTMYLTYDQYPDRWDEIAGVFGKEAVLRGSFDKYAASRRKRGTAQVDTEFLKEIETWRGALARNIALRNPALDVRELNFAVQRTIDRIIFLRMCEDRGVEKYATLQALMSGTGTYARLLELFTRADDRYNSGLFHFRDETARSEAPDTLTPALAIDDKVLKDIFKALYYPDSPYEFSVLPADILGNVYEQFLGKVIHLTPGHRARVEEKPEVKKAGGVYYTPKYIVDYIVEHTVGRLLLKDDVAHPPSAENVDHRPSAEQKQTTQQPGAAALQENDVAQPPNVAHPPSAENVDQPPSAENVAHPPDVAQPPNVAQPPSAEPKQTTQQPGAAALQDLSAYKTPQDIGGLTDTFRPSKTRRPLRILDPACGSGSFLIGAYRKLLAYHRDWYLADGPQKHTERIYQGAGGQWYLTTEEKKRILLANIYGVDIDPQAVEVTKLNLLLCVLENETRGSLGQLALFHQRALPDLGSNIKCGNSLIGTDFYAGKQLDLFDDETKYKINAFDWETEFPQVFQGKNPGFDAVIGNPPYIDSEWMARVLPETREYCKGRYKAASGNWDIFCVFSEKALRLCRRDGLSSLIVPNKLGAASYAAGARTVLSKKNCLLIVRDYSRVAVFPVAVYPIVYVVRKRDPRSEGSVRYERVTGGADVNSHLVQQRMLPYAAYFSEPQLPWRVFGSVDSGDPSERMRTEFPALEEVASVLGAATVSEAYEIQELIREDADDAPAACRVINSGTIDRYRALWGTKRLRYLGDSYLKPVIPCKLLEQLPAKRKEQTLASKIVVAGMTKTLECVLDPQGEFLAAKSTSIIFPEIDAHYLLGLLNSRLISSYYSTVYGGNRLSGGYLRIGPPQLRKIPIRTIDFTDAADKARHDRIVALVETMLDLHKSLAPAKTGHEKTLIKRQITATDKQIDQLVYELYGLTDEEIRIVEEATG